MKKFIAIITLVSMLSCVSCSEKTENSSVASSSSSKIESSSVAESSEEESSEEESGSADVLNEDDYTDWNGLRMYFPVPDGNNRESKSTSKGCPVWMQLKGEKPAIDFVKGYSYTTKGGVGKLESELAPEDVIDDFFKTEVDKIIDEAYGTTVVKERTVDTEEKVKVLDKDFIRQSGTITANTNICGETQIYYVCYVGTPGFKSNLFKNDPAMWIAFSNDETDKDSIAEMADRAANDLEYTK